MRNYLLLLLLSFCLAVPSYAQNETDTVETEDEWNDWDEWENEDENKWDDKWDNDFKFWDITGAPTIAANYGLAKLSYHNFSGAFIEPRSFQIKLGYTDMDEALQTSNITENSFKYVSLSNITSDLSNPAEDDLAYETNSWRIGLGKSSGYGYKFGPSALIFISGNSLDWTRLKMIETPTDSLDHNITDLFNNTFRFGNSFEASVRFQIIREISLEADYERAIVFPRHLFWKWLGSAVIENIGQFFIDEFLEKILDSNPYFAPVLGFLLKNGLNYGLYELRKEKMNWPFNSSAPLMYDQFKFGVTFVL